MVVLTLTVSFILSTVQTAQLGRAFAALLHSQPAGADVTPLFGRLADIVAGLNSAPFALYCSHGWTDRRLPEALVRMARDAAAQGAEVEDRFYDLISDLPHLDLPGDNAARFEALRAWAGQQRLGLAGGLRGGAFGNEKGRAVSRTAPCPSIRFPDQFLA